MTDAGRSVSIYEISSGHSVTRVILASIVKLDAIVCQRTTIKLSVVLQSYNIFHLWCLEMYHSTKNVFQFFSNFLCLEKKEMENLLLFIRG